MSEVVIARCVRCRVDFPLETEACPQCGTTGRPMSPQDDVSVDINWHELRILAMWAERWALYCDQHFKPGTLGPMLPIVFAVVKPLQEQYPSRLPLTLSAELEQVRDAGYAVETNVPRGGPLPPKLH